MKRENLKKLADIQTGPFGSQLHKEDYVENGTPDENIWLPQKMMAALYGVSITAISQHIKHIYKDGKLMPEATIKKYYPQWTRAHTPQPPSFDGWRR